MQTPYTIATNHQLLLLLGWWLGGRGRRRYCCVRLLRSRAWLDERLCHCCSASGRLGHGNSSMLDRARHTRTWPWDKNNTHYITNKYRRSQVQTVPGSCFPKTDQYKPTSWGNLWLWFSVIRLKMFCTADSDTRNTGRTVVAMETRRWHAHKSNFSGTCGTQRSGRLAFSQRMRKNGLNRINLTI